jgi:hypothetical protein
MEPAADISAISSRIYKLDTDNRREVRSNNSRDIKNTIDDYREYRNRSAIHDETIDTDNTKSHRGAQASKDTGNEYITKSLITKYVSNFCSYSKLKVVLKGQIRLH